MYTHGDINKAISAVKQLKKQTSDQKAIADISGKEIKQVDNTLAKENISNMIEQIELDLKLLYRVQKKELLKNLETSKDQDYIEIIREASTFANFQKMGLNKIQAMIDTQKKLSDKLLKAL